MEFDFSYTDLDFGLEHNAKSGAQARRMNHALTQLVAHPSWSDQQICEAVDINKQTLCRYRKNDQFMKYYQEACQRWFKSLQAKAVEALNRKLNKDDWNAVKYVLDGNDYGATQKLDVATDAVININIVEGDDD